jgi:hypothetical protein
MKKHFLFILGIFTIGLVFLAVSCSGTSVFIPEATQLEQPPIKVTATQLYQEYMADEAAADARYKGKKVWVTEAVVDTYLESESGCYLEMRWRPEELVVHRTFVSFHIRPFSVSTVILEPQFSEGFRDIPPAQELDLRMLTTHNGNELGEFVDEMYIVRGYMVEVVGECQGISEGVITFEITRITKAGGSLPDPKIW